MKKIFIMAVIALFCGATYAFDTLPVNVQMDWKECRARSATSDTGSATLTTGALRAWTAKPAAAKPLYAASSVVGIRFHGVTDSNTATYTVWVYRSGDAAELVCTGTITNGSMTRAAGVFVDTITHTDTWVTTVYTSNASGGNQMATLWFDTLGCSYIYVEMTSRTDTFGCDYTYVN